MSSTDASECPICAQPNGCEIAAGESTCWCFHRDVAPELVAFLAARGLDDRCLCARCAAGDVPSPCIGICALDEATRTCSGCRRTMEEIAGWARLGPVERAAVHLRVRPAPR